MTNGDARDTDELIKQRGPVYSARITPGLLERDVENVPMACGEAQVFPRNLIVADGDGVTVVPVEHIEKMAAIAREIANDDKAGRRRKYEEAGLEADETVRPLD